jgi:hypothetical protein
MDRIAAMESLKQAIGWIALAACTAPIWGTLLWSYGKEMCGPG